MKSVMLAVVGVATAALIVGGYLLWTPDKSRADLESKYLQARSDYVETAGMRLHVRDVGPKDKPALILLHGFGSSLHTWEAWAKILADDYRVISLDLPGFGLTGADPTGDYTDARGIAVIIAESVSRLFLRNSIARAIPIFMAPGITGLIEDGETLEVDYPQGQVTNTVSGKSIAMRKFPPLIEKIFACGGLPEFARERYLAETAR